MLLKIKATKSSIKLPVRTGESTYQKPISFIFSVPITAIRAVAPPGGWSVLVICIKIIEKDTANGAASQIISGNTLCIATPAIAEIKWPPTKFRG